MTENRENNSKVKILTVLFIAVLLCLMFVNQEYVISASVKKAQEGEFKDKELPPALALTTIAVGPMRGLITNVLWWRVIEQQDDGNFFEIIQLTEWITVLQPSNPKVWTFQAWNMAFNVSSEFPDAESKWKWILKSLNLLRGKGLDYNPGNMTIRTEIGRLFYDRIGRDVDNCAEYYKRQWAYTMAAYIPNGSTEELKGLAAAPLTEKELKALPDMPEFLSKAEKQGLKLMDSKEFYNFLAWTPEQKKFINSKPGYKKLLLKMDYFYKAKKLRTEQKLDPERMLYIDEQFGPFDWRLYHAHVVYWLAEGSFEDYLNEKVNTQPMIRQAMQRSFMDGRLLFDPQAGIFSTTNNFRIIGKVHDYYEHLMKVDPGPLSYSLHQKFVKKAAAVLYTFNKIKEAEKVFEHYKEDSKDEEDKNLDFDTFIANSLYTVLHSSTNTDTKILIEGALYQAYNWLAVGEYQRATGYANYAKLIWSRHQKKFADRPSFLLPTFEQFKAVAYEKVMESSMAPEFKSRLLQARGKTEFKIGDEKVYLGHGIKEKPEEDKNKDNNKKQDIQ